MSAIFDLPPDPKNPIRLVNARVLGQMCGRFPTHEAAEAKLQREGYAPDEYWREGSTVVFLGSCYC